VLLELARRGDAKAREAVYAVSFTRLRAIASSLLHHERRNHTLQPTALVGELFLKLQRLRVPVVDEDHFFRLSARAMRQVLIDHARRRGPVEQWEPESAAELLAKAHSGAADYEALITVRVAFKRLEELDRLAAQAVWLRAVEGLTLSRVSEVQRREIWRVRADYDFGIRWLSDRIGGQAVSRSAAKHPDQARMSGGRCCGPA
jgi:RNA polymerase sigma factor (TIGR02999 family)